MGLSIAHGVRGWDRFFAVGGRGENKRARIVDPLFEHAPKGGLAIRAPE